MCFDLKPDLMFLNKTPNMCYILEYVYVVLVSEAHILEYVYVI